MDSAQNNHMGNFKIIIQIQFNVDSAVNVQNLAVVNTECFKSVI